MIAERQGEVGATGNTRKIVLQMLGGGVFGFVAMLGLDRFFNLEVLFDTLSGPAIIAFAFAVIFALIAFIVFGMSVSRTLFMTNHRHEGTSDAEFADVKPVLRWSSICLLLYAAALWLLAMVGQAEAGQKMMFFWGVVAAMAGQTAISLHLWRRYDELYRGVTRESCATAFVISEIVLFIWGAAVLCGLPVTFDPLAVIVAVMGIYWAASLWYISKRGMV